MAPVAISFLPHSQMANKYAGISDQMCFVEIWNGANLATGTLDGVVSVSQWILSMFEGLSEWENEILVCPFLYDSSFGKFMPLG